MDKITYDDNRGPVYGDVSAISHFCARKTYIGEYLITDKHDKMILLVWWENSQIIRQQRVFGHKSMLYLFNPGKKDSVASIRIWILSDDRTGENYLSSQGAMFNPAYGSVVNPPEAKNKKGYNISVLE